MPTVEEPKPDIPRICIRVRRLGDYLQLEIGNMKLKNKSIGNQEYDLVTLEQFITRAATYSYEKIIERDILIKNLASLDKDKDELSSRD